MSKELKPYKGYRVFKTVDEYNDVYYYFLEKEFKDIESEYYWSLTECHKAINEWIEEMKG